MSIGDWLNRIGSLRQGTMGCAKCGATFSLRQAERNRLGDIVCPECGSLNTKYRATRAERARSFLIDYNTY